MIKRQNDGMTEKRIRHGVITVSQSANEYNNNIDFYIVHTPAMQIKALYNAYKIKFKNIILNLKSICIFLN